METLKHTFLLLVLLFSLPTTTTSQNEILIRLSDSATPQEIQQLLIDYNATEVAISPLSKIRKWVLNPTGINAAGDQLFQIGGPGGGLYNIEDTGDELRKKTKVDSAEENFSDNLSTTSLEVPACSPLDNINEGGCNVVVAVIDTGIDENHPEFDGKLWSNENEILDFIDNDFNSYVDDMHGYDFAYGVSMPTDLQSHGTHISGIIADLSSQSNSNIDIMSLKSMDNSGFGNIFDIILAVDYAVMNGANIINMSFGYTTSEANYTKIKTPPLKYAIDLAGTYNVLVVTSAGNSGIDIDGDNLKTYPAEFTSSNLITVSAVDCNNTLASFSNYGNKSVDVGARGVNITSAIPQSMGSYGVKSGTSQAAAFVSGTAAVLGTNSCPFKVAKIKSAILDGAEFATISPANSLNLLTAISEGRSSDVEQNLIEDEIFKVLAFPQPVDNLLNLSISNAISEKTTFTFYDLNGRLISQRNDVLAEGENLFTFNLEGFQRGIYILKVKTELKTKMLKVYKE